MDPLTLSMIIGGGASLLSGFFGNQAANQAAQTQANATDKATALEASTLAQAHADAAPWLAAGKTALDAYQGELGLSPAAQNGTFKSGFTTTPAYAFQQEEGDKGVVNNMRSLGLGGSGAALKAIDRFNSGLADTTYQQYLDRLSGASTSGQTTEANSSNQSIQGSQVIGQGIENAGAETASGYVGGANAITGALGNFANNAGQALGSYDQNWMRIAA